jgi:pilus assembly protein CpaF
MLRLTIVEHGKPPREASFDRFPVSIGRAPGNAVVLPGWKVARTHAEIHQLPGGFKLVDKGSLAGTWVNGERVVEYGPLEETDEVIIGGFQLRAHVAAVRTVRAAAPVRQEAGSAARANGQLAAGAHVAAISARNGTAHRAQLAENLQLVQRGFPSAAPEPQAAMPVVAPAAPVPAATDRDLERYLAGFEWRRKLHRMLLETIDLRRKDLRQFSDQDLRAETELLVREILANSLKLPPGIDPEELITDVLDEVVGLGALERLLADQNVTEIMVNSADEIFVERSGKLERCRAAFTSDEAIRSVIDRIVAPLGRRIDEASPMVDARLKDGSRVNAIIPPLALRGPTITIRKFNKRLFGVEDYIRLGSANAAMFEFLKICVECRKNIVISGGTGSGKTTLLNILSNLIPRGERIITIEDAAELKLNAPHLVSLEARPSNVEGKGVIAIRDLVRNSLRMRPDRIVVGECRGGEALDMLQAMNTGHDGSLTTAHANSPRDVISRLEVMTLMAGMDIPMSAVREQIASAVDVIVQQTRLSDGSRRITSITEVTGVENGTVQLLELFRFERHGFGPNNEVLGHFTGCDAVPTFYEDLRRIGVKLDLDVFSVVKPEDGHG